MDRNSNNFDFLRLIAALCVVFHHAGVFTHREWRILPDLFGRRPFMDLNLGYVGVGVFFVLSGYLIAQSWMRTQHAGKFLWARALRLVPALVVAALLTILVFAPLLTTLPLGQFWLNAGTWSYLRIATVLAAAPNPPGVLLEHNINTPLWTLPVEVKMYGMVLMLGVCGLMAVRRKVLAFAAFCLYVLLYRDHVLPFTRGLFDGLDQLGLPSIVGHLVENQTNHYPFLFIVGVLLFLYRDRVRYHWAIGLLAGVVVVLSHYTFRYATLNLLVLPYAVLTVAFARIPLVNNLGRGVGDLSYGTYIFAFPVQCVVARFAPSLSTGQHLALALAIILPLAFASWHLVEKRALAFKNVWWKDAPAR